MKRPSLVALVSPVSLLVVAAVLTIAYTACHAAGWRQHVSIFSGTLSVSSPAATQIALAGLYAGLYFAFVLLVPVLVLASVLQLLGLRLLLRKSPRPPAENGRSGGEDDNPPEGYSSAP
jgi:hypothetical protein